MSRVQLVLSAWDIGIIEEALQDSALHWQGAADEAARRVRVCMALGAHYQSAAPRHHREQARLERIVKQRRDTLVRLRQAKEVGKIC